MFQNFNNPAAAYERVGVDVKVQTASPHELVLMLYDGARMAVATAAAQARAGNRAAMSASITKASAIIYEGLRASLDVQAGGPIAQNLASLYDYMSVRLQFANLRGDPAIFDEVIGLLDELRGAWAEIGNDPAVHSPNRTAA
jgi:flagellar protein FliS